MNHIVYVVCGMSVVDSHDVRHDMLSIVEVSLGTKMLRQFLFCRAAFPILPVSALILAEVTHI